MQETHRNVSQMYLGGVGKILPKIIITDLVVMYRDAAPKGSFQLHLFQSEDNGTVEGEA